MAERTKIFIIDDSPLIRYALTQLINEESEYFVIGSEAASSGAIHQIEKSKTNILIIDVPVPRKKGIKFLKKIHGLRLPVIVFTKSDQTIARDLIPLLEAGAVGFVLKPTKDEDISLVKEQILHELKVNTRKVTPKPLTTTQLTFLEPLKIIAIGSSTGGPEALMSILTQIPEDFPYGIVIVQHMPAGFTNRFAKRLDNQCKIRVKEAETGDMIAPGLVLLAPGDYHMVFDEILRGNKRMAQVKLNQDPPMWGLRPTVDNMMSTIAPIYQRNCVGIILTGMGDDGVIGMRAIKQFGGQTIVQNEATSVVFGMAQEVIKNNLADEVLPLDTIIPRAIELLKKKI